jgi:hypothetical protein
MGINGLRLCRGKLLVEIFPEAKQDLLTSHCVSLTAALSGGGYRFETA